MTPELDLGLAELCGVRRDDEVAHHRKLAAASERKSGDRRDDGFAASGEPIPAADEVLAVDLHEGLDCISLMSAPAAKAFSDPVSTMQPIASSALGGVERLVQLGDKCFV